MGRKRKVMHFKSKKAYIRWLRYGHVTKVFERTPGHTEVYIRGKKHKVKHVRKKRRRKKK